jgi:hypothetical protein
MLGVTAEQERSRGVAHEEGYVRIRSVDSVGSGSRWTIVVQHNRPEQQQQPDSGRYSSRNQLEQRQSIHHPVHNPVEQQL